MKRTIFYLFFLLIIVCSVSAGAQINDTTTVILVRHGEKDTVGRDPQLSAAGKARAEKLSTLFKNINPDLFYSTPYVRTRQALAPWAKKANVEIQEYNPTDFQGFVEKLRSIKGKTIVVAGHSNTIPVLVNLLIGTNKYVMLSDDDYSTLWIVKIIDGKATEQTIKY